MVRKLRKIIVGDQVNIELIHFPGKKIKGTAKVKEVILNSEGKPKEWSITEVKMEDYNIRTFS